VQDLRNLAYYGFLKLLNEVFNMKAKILISILFFLGLFSNISLANEKDCDSDDLFCGYFTGLKENDPTDGRYLKIQSKRLGEADQTMVMCVDNALVFGISTDMVEEFLGNTEMVFYICTDQNGTQCGLVKDFFVNITKTNNVYIANPTRMQIDLAPYAAKYPRCDGTLPHLNLKKGHKPHTLA
jgi:hypothetical protein